MLKIRPFHYGLIINCVYDNGSIFSPAVLDITDDDVIKTFCSVSKQINIEFYLGTKDEIIIQMTVFIYSILPLPSHTVLNFFFHTTDIIQGCPGLVEYLMRRIKEPFQNNKKSTKDA